MHHLDKKPIEERPIIHILKRINDDIEWTANNMLKESDLTLAQGHVLGFLRHRPDNKAPLKELERSLNVAQSTSQGIVSRVEKKGFITTYTDESDKRVKIVALTELGLQSLDGVKAKLDEVDEIVLTPLNDDEKIEIKKLLGKILQSLKNYDPQR